MGATDGPMAGRVCMVTGASSGIGRATAVALAGQGAHVVLVCRDRGRGEAAAADARAAAAAAGAGGPVELELCDLASQAAVRELAARAGDRLDRLHVLVNNAGMLFGVRSFGPDGLERTFALNHLAYFLLTNLLLGRLEASAPARVVNVASDAHRTAHLDFDDLQGERGYRGMRAYSRSKLANLLFTYELARRLQGTGVTVNAAHPGTVASGFGRDGVALFRLGVRLARPFMRSPERGADTVVWLASSPEVEGVSGAYFADRRQRRSSAASYNEAAARRLWDESAKLTGLPVA